MFSFTYLKGRMTEKETSRQKQRGTETFSPPVYYQKADTARAEAGQNREQGIPSASVRVAGLHVLEPSPAASMTPHYQEVELEVEARLQLGHSDVGWMPQVAA